MTRDADKKPKIMIVDDDTFLLDMYAMKFTSSGYDVLPASSGEAALELLGEHSDRISFALIDLVMPEMDGFTLLEEARERGHVEKIKFIVLSNLSQEADVSRAKELGAIDYIVKANFTPSEVVERVEEVIIDQN